MKRKRISVKTVILLSLLFAAGSYLLAFLFARFINRIGDHEWAVWVIHISVMINIMVVLFGILHTFAEWKFTNTMDKNE